MLVVWGNAFFYLYKHNSVIHIKNTEDKQM